MSPSSLSIVSSDPLSARIMTTNKVRPIAVIVAAANFYGQVVQAQPGPPYRLPPTSQEILEKHEYGRLAAPIFDDDTPEIAKIAVTGDLAAVRKLIQGGADVNASGRERRTALHFAAAYRRLEVVKFLLEAKAKINAQDSQGDTPLQMAASSGVESTALYLISHGADVNIANKENETPLILASSVGSESIVSALLDAHATRDVTDVDGRTAADWARLNKHPEIVKLLNSQRESK